MAFFTFYCLDTDGTASTFRLKELADESAALMHAEALFQEWTSCSEIEIGREDTTTFVIDRADVSRRRRC